MKKVLYLLAAVLILIACDKKEEDPTFEQADFIGTWKQTIPAPAEVQCTEYNLLVEFTATEMKNITECDGSKSSVTLDYEFDGRAITYELIFTMRMTIVSLSETELVVNNSVDGIPGSEKITYTKVE